MFEFPLGFSRFFFPPSSGGNAEAQAWVWRRKTCLGETPLPVKQANQWQLSKVFRARMEGGLNKEIPEGREGTLPGRSEI